MGGTVLGSAGTPFCPWHAAQSCAFASISSAACAGGTASARPIPIPKIAEKKRVCMTRFLPLPRGAKVWQDTAQVSSGEPYASQADVDPCRHRRRGGVSDRQR